MSYAMKIPSVSFSSIAVDRVTYIVPIPCTGISLSSSTLTFDKAEETQQLTATLTPADTTDTLLWSSSNENVATVDNGIVTIHGIGTATITATCGNQTATASITQTTIKAQYNFTKIENKYPTPTGNAQSETRGIKLDTISSQFAVGQIYHSSNTDLHLTNSTDIECIRVPYGATKVFFDVKSGESDFTVSYLQFATTEVVTISSVQCAKWLKENTSVSAVAGKDVEYGQCIILRVLAAQEAKMGDYAYFT